MRKVSQAATSLCLWVSAMVIYSQVAKDVEPKRQRGMHATDSVHLFNI